jgi:ribulose-5-phosphate 4-epimerase/fuculose-1-phosphate aldolase
LAEAVKLQANAGREVFKYELGRRVLAEFDRADTHAVVDASQAAFDAEVDFIDHGLARAGESPAKAALLARHVERVANINDRRITRRFGY